MDEAIPVSSTAFEKSRRKSFTERLHEDPHLQEDVELRRLLMMYRLRVHAGKYLHEWKHPYDLNVNPQRRRSPPFFPREIYPFSNQKALFNRYVIDLWNKLSWNAVWTQACKLASPAEIRFRFGSASNFWSGTWAQRCIVAPICVFYEILLPLVWLICFILAVLCRLMLETNWRFPVLSFLSWISGKNGLGGVETLDDGENGYTEVYQGGGEIDVDQLEMDLMTRNRSSYNEEQHTNLITVSVSYKHYANKGKGIGDDHRICRTDLKAIAMLIKAAGSCKLRFWIDSKLPETTDSTFERWINRGVRPYGRYITFLCPSAQEYAESSFWLSNEFYFAVSAKGVLYCKDDEILFEHSYGFELHLLRRLLCIVIGAEGHPVQVRNEDAGKVVHWALCCLRAEKDKVKGARSPMIDRLVMNGKAWHNFSIMQSIARVVRECGKQELPVIPGRSWNKGNPLLLYGIPDQTHDLSDWHGLCLDDDPSTVYFLHRDLLFEVRYGSTTTLEVSLDRPYHSGGTIRIVRKLLRQMKSEILLRCKFVTLPWMCDWE